MPSASAADAMAHLSEIAPGTSRLCLADQSLEKLPGSFWQSARDLKDIDLHNNQLTDFPSQNLSECSKLQVSKYKPIGRLIPSDPFIADCL